MLNFNFLEKGPGRVSPPHFVYDFSRKLFPMLNSIKSIKFVKFHCLIPLRLKIFVNMLLQLFINQIVTS